MQQTIGWYTGREIGGLREWARLSVWHFERDKILSCAQAQRGITLVLKKGYIKLRRAMVERLTPHLEQSLKDLHQPAVRSAIIRTPEE